MEGGKRGKNKGGSSKVLQSAGKKSIGNNCSPVEPALTVSEANESEKTIPQCVPKAPVREMRVLLKRYIGPSCIRVPLVQVNGHAKSSRSIAKVASKTTENSITKSSTALKDSKMDICESPPSKKCKIEVESKNSSTSTSKISDQTIKSTKNSKIKKHKIIENTNESLINNPDIINIKNENSQDLNSELNTTLSEIKDCKINSIENDSVICDSNDENSKSCKDKSVNINLMPDCIVFEEIISESTIEITESCTEVTDLKHSDKQSVSSESSVFVDNNLKLESNLSNDSANCKIINTIVNKKEVNSEPIQSTTNHSDANTKEKIESINCTAEISEIAKEHLIPEDEIKTEIKEDIEISIEFNTIQEIKINDSQEHNETELKEEKEVVVKKELSLFNEVMKIEEIEHCQEIPKNTESLTDMIKDKDQCIITENVPKSIDTELKLTSKMTEISTVNSVNENIDTIEQENHNAISDTLEEIEIKKDNPVKMRIVKPLKKVGKKCKTSTDKNLTLELDKEEKSDIDTTKLLDGFVEDVVIKQEPDTDAVNNKDSSTSPRGRNKNSRGRGRPRGPSSPRIKRVHSPDEYIPDQVIAPVIEVVRTRPVRRIKKPKALCECCSSSSHHEEKKVAAKNTNKTTTDKLPEILEEKVPAKPITKKAKISRLKKAIKIEPIEPENTNNLIDSIESDHSYTSPLKESSSEESPKLQISPISPISSNNKVSPVNLIKLSLVKTNLNNTKLSDCTTNTEAKPVSTSVAILTPEELIKKLQFKLIQQEKEFKTQVEGLQKLASLEKLKADLIHNNMKTQESKFQLELEKERKRCKEYKKQVSDCEKQLSDLKYKVKKLDKEHSKCENKISDYLNKKRSFETTLLLYQNKLSVSDTSKCTLKKKVIKYRKQRNKAKIRFMQSTNRKYFSDAESDAEYEKEMTRQREERDKKFSEEELEYSDSSPTVEEMEAQFSDASKLQDKESEAAGKTEPPSCNNSTSTDEPKSEVHVDDNDDGSYTPPLPEEPQIKIEAAELVVTEPLIEVTCKPLSEETCKPLTEATCKENIEVTVKEERDVGSSEQKDVKLCLVDENISNNSQESPTKKGILIFPGLRERIPGIRKSVIFGDGIKPGEDIDDTQRHRTHSPPPLNKISCKKIKGRKVRKFRKKKKKEVEDTEEDKTVPPPPPGSPPLPLKQYYQQFTAAVAAGYYYHRDRNVYTPLAQSQQVNKVPSSTLPSMQTINGGPALNTAIGSPNINASKVSLIPKPPLPGNVNPSSLLGPKLTIENPPLPAGAPKMSSNNKPPLLNNFSNPPLPTTKPPEIPPPPPPLPPEDMDIVPPIPPPPNSPPPLPTSLPPLPPSAPPPLPSNSVQQILNAAKKVVEWNHSAQPSTTRYEDSFISSFQPVLPSTSQESDNILSPDISCVDYPPNYPYPDSYNNQGFNREGYNNDEVCYTPDESQNFYEPLFQQERQYNNMPTSVPYPNDNTSTFRHSRFDVTEPIKFRVGFNNRCKNISWVRSNPKLINQDFTSDDPIIGRGEFKMSQLMPQLSHLGIPPPPIHPKPLLSEIIEPPSLCTPMPIAQPLLPDPLPIMWKSKNKKKKKKTKPMFKI